MAAEFEWLTDEQFSWESAVKLGQAVFPGIELVYTSHSRWPLPRAHEGGTSSTEYDLPRSLAVSVLDSSFNPPTMAHLALARMPIPPSHDAGSAFLRSSFDARLLLFSIKNADKTLKPGDATHLQRLEMMVLLATELERDHQALRDQGLRNVAVAVCQEPTFVGKSTALRLFLRERLSAVLSAPDSPAIQLFFLLGFDTLQRLFAARYYDSDATMKNALHRFFSSSGDNSRVICARRSTGASYAHASTSVPDAAMTYFESGAVALVDIGEDERSLSSSEVREYIRDSKGGWEHKVPTSVAEYIKEHFVYKLPG